MTAKKKFLEDINRGQKTSSSYLGVFVKSPNAASCELIINPAENLRQKSAYYDEAYNDALELKSYPAIKIIGYSIGALDTIMEEYFVVLGLRD